MRDKMKKGDMGFFYHSSCKVPGIIGTVEIVKEAYPDHTAFDKTEKYYDAKSDPDNPRWVMVDVKLKSKFKTIIPLTQLREVDALKDMTLVQKGSRLSVQPVTAKEWKAIMKIAE